MKNEEKTFEKEMRSVITRITGLMTKYNVRQFSVQRNCIYLTAVDTIYGERLPLKFEEV